LDGVFGHPSLMSDGVHPNDAGYAVVAERVRRVVEPLLK
jgi:lysophospholipase L1-like esterase